jgi:type VI secretion system protein ImpH
MPTESRRKNTSVATRLAEGPAAFSFVQAMRLLERICACEQRLAKVSKANPSLLPVAGFSPPTREAVRLRGNQSLSFPGAQISSLTHTGGQWQMRVNHIGLAGSMGVMPFHYSELLHQRLKQKDYSLRDFLDLFNHRIASLFYQASIKYRLPLQYERRPLLSSRRHSTDSHSLLLLSLVGMGTPGLTRRATLKDEALVYYAGLFSSQVRTASGLKQILEHYFGIAVSVQEFVGQWEELIEDVRTKLSSRAQPKGQNTCLGKTVVLGKKGWFAQGAIRICLGPLNYEQFLQFAPGTTSLNALNELVRMYVGIERDYSFIIRVQRENFPRDLSLGGSQKPLLGWNTWVASSTESAEDDEKHLTIRVSAQRLK